MSAPTVEDIADHLRGLGVTVHDMRGNLATHATRTFTDRDVGSLQGVALFIPSWVVASFIPSYLNFVWGPPKVYQAPTVQDLQKPSVASTPLSSTLFSLMRMCTNFLYFTKGIP